MYSTVANEKTIDNDTDLFRQTMSDVKPLSDKKSGQQRITAVQRVKPRPPPQHHSPVADATTAHQFIPREHVAEVAPEERLFFARSGLQQRNIRRLKRGECRVEASLDLHGQTLAEAGEALFVFLRDCQQAGQRCALIVHGKGHRSATGKPRLKAQLQQWLRDEPEILAFSSALPRDGGSGALYVLIRSR